MPFMDSRLNTQEREILKNSVLKKIARMASEEKQEVK